MTGNNYLGLKSEKAAKEIATFLICWLIIFGVVKCVPLLELILCTENISFIHSFMHLTGTDADIFTFFLKKQWYYCAQQKDSGQPSLSDPQ